MHPFIALSPSIEGQTRSVQIPPAPKTRRARPVRSRRDPPRSQCEGTDGPCDRAPGAWTDVVWGGDEKEVDVSLRPLGSGDGWSAVDLVLLWVDGGGGMGIIKRVGQEGVYLKQGPRDLGGGRYMWRGRASA